MVGNFGMLPAVIVAVIVGLSPVSFRHRESGSGSIIKIPDFAIIWNTLSPFAIGFPSIGKIISVIPTAIAVYIIAFGDFVSSEQLIRSAEEVRTDEHIDFNANRSNIISAIRNIIQALSARIRAFAVRSGQPLLLLYPNVTRMAEKQWIPFSAESVPSVGPPLSVLPLFRLHLLYSRSFRQLCL